jgi:hypothetical protein
MKTFNSVVQQRGAVAFPEFTGERVYMREFRKADDLPFDLARWQPTVDAMLDGVTADGPLYLMIDQGVVRGGVSHRRPGVHIDGYWNPAVRTHGGTGGHIGKSAHGGGRHVSGADTWADSDYIEREGILLASSVQAARAFDGSFVGQPGVGGDCTHIDLSGLREIPMLSGYAYAGNVTMLHESVPMAFDCERTLVRINVPGWSV